MHFSSLMITICCERDDGMCSSAQMHGCRFRCDDAEYRDRPVKTRAQAKADAAYPKLRRMLVDIEMEKMETERDADHEHHGDWHSRIASGLLCTPLGFGASSDGHVRQPSRDDAPEEATRLDAARERATCGSQLVALSVSAFLRETNDNGNQGLPIYCEWLRSSIR